MENDKLEYYYRQVMAVKSLYLAMNGKEEEAEALRFFLRKVSEKEKCIEFPTGSSSIRNAA